MAFDFLPNLEKCCFCLPLKIGCILITFHIFISVYYTSLITAKTLQVCLGWLQYAALPVNAFLALNAVLFLIGLIFKLNLIGCFTFIFFICKILLFIIMLVQGSVAVYYGSIIVRKQDKFIYYCAYGGYFIFGLDLVGLLFNIYYLIILNSYKNEVAEDSD